MKTIPDSPLSIGSTLKDGLEYLYNLDYKKDPLIIEIIEVELANYSIYEIIETLMNDSSINNDIIAAVYLCGSGFKGTVIKVDTTSQDNVVVTLENNNSTFQVIISQFHNPKLHSISKL